MINNIRIKYIVNLEVLIVIILFIAIIFYIAFSSRISQSTPDAEQLTSDMIIIDLFESLLYPSSYIANNVVIDKDDAVSLLPSVNAEYQMGFLYELEISINEINVERFIDTDVYNTKYISRTQKIIDISKFSRPLICDLKDNCYFEIGRNVCKHHFEKIRRGIIEEINGKTEKRLSVLKRIYKKNEDQYSYDDMPYLESIIRLQRIIRCPCPRCVLGSQVSQKSEKWVIF